LLQNVEEDAPLPAAQHQHLDLHSPGANHSHGDHSHRANGYALHPAPHRLHSSQSIRKTYSHGSLASTHSHETGSEHAEPHDHHHHHVPTNAFLSIGLQTSLAIALHKLPEGFITYATNHANPKLGFAVFLALFVHNITEGFAMALPLYLAVGSRWKAMFWSALLGGVSQPLGAGVAALWLRLSGRAGSGGVDEGGEGVYGCMFAATAGIMASVALQLFSESLDLTHNRNLCMAFAFVGMGILGMSSALTA
jgi:zinc transporter, ZIP family